MHVIPLRSVQLEETDCQALRRQVRRSIRQLATNGDASPPASTLTSHDRSRASDRRSQATPACACCRQPAFLYQSLTDVTLVVTFDQHLRLDEPNLHVDDIIRPIFASACRDSLQHSFTFYTSRLSGQPSSSSPAFFWQRGSDSAHLQRPTRIMTLHVMLYFPGILRLTTRVG